MAKKGRREKYAGIPLAVLQTRKYASLNGWAVKLLVDFAAQYNGPGRNNGDLSAPFESVMRFKGWRSKGTLNKALRDLEAVGFIVKTRQGGRNHCSLYALTWQPIDDCIDPRTKKSKHDAKPTIAAPGTWKDDDSEAA